MADWRLGDPYKARITKVHMPQPVSSPSASTLPAIKVNVKFIADGETLSKLSITKIKIPEAKGVETFKVTKKKRKATGNRIKGKQATQKKRKTTRK